MEQPSATIAVRSRSPKPVFKNGHQQTVNSLPPHKAVNLPFFGGHFQKPQVQARALPNALCDLQGHLHGRGWDRKVRRRFRKRLTRGQRHIHQPGWRCRRIHPVGYDFIPGAPLAGRFHLTEATLDRRPQEHGCYRVFFDQDVPGVRSAPDALWTASRP